MMEQARIEIEGMSCGHCVASVKAALGQLGGVEVQEVKVGSATVAYDPRLVQPEQIAAAVDAEGYAAQVAQG
ncbi:MAG: heavy-metal-associated domain-containing protein [Longimicrobiaceae bacterium]